MDFVDITEISHIFRTAPYEFSQPLRGGGLDRRRRYHDESYGFRRVYEFAIRISLLFHSRLASDTFEQLPDPGTGYHAIRSTFSADARIRICFAQYNVDGILWTGESYGKGEEILVPRSDYWDVSRTSIWTSQARRNNFGLRISQSPRLPTLRPEYQRRMHGLCAGPAS